MPQRAPGKNEPYLLVENVTKRFGNFYALREVGLAASAGEFVCILGPSGCGKTTMLRVVAGLESHEAGRVVLAGRDVTGLPVSRRNVGIVFQSYALFPNLTAAENVGYGLKSRNAARGARHDRVKELLRLVGLTGLGEVYPARLSGGQQQRVALARAMALSPKLLLLDEPLSALDAKVRIMLRGEIRALQRRLGVTTVMVTHDQEEALTMADRILVMHEGMVVQDGSPRDIYDAPATPFVASFIGSMNFIGGGKRHPDGTVFLGNRSIRGANGPRIARGAGDAGEVTLAIRPEDVTLAPRLETGPDLWPGKTRHLEFRGGVYRVGLSLFVGGGERGMIADVSAETVRRMELREDMGLSVGLCPDRMHVYRQETHVAEGA
ncbi:ATP-binding cassette domain-containing protein [Desulfovibrio sulfodismutans]|uniref:ATP-binding cassette domain-containing protein n=1 Tax=Desulfolutivibrio sulfodismutans TaxID=63561 RepID=A0A7K3NJ91_9BACT|nr:ATP-binding cassette domain-containing protein [Desulfolutivibrio sulfodismutans]NDY56264.1 ATP-binding cassette domain-containing protein [Desulfolutivibrio sulfodismutans]QLA11318.1 ATP-binding cassette domain-containing protein [Desulfolutivibrio sulfodismutans DSM 3696]